MLGYALDPHRPILICEDNPNDVKLLTFALTEAGITHPIQFVADGRQVLDYLGGREQFADRRAFPFPQVVILDLKMPRLDGLQVLQWIKDHPECTVIPTIILTSSAHDGDIQEAYSLGANAYLVKPDSLPELQRVLRLTFDYWSTCAKPAVPARCA